MKRIISLALSVMLILSAFAFSAVSFSAADGTITYNFSKTTAGYAEGTITLNASAGTYWLYWADDTKALDGYYKIAKLTITGTSASHSMYAQTAIPADATKLIAFKSTSEPTTKTVASASAVYTIPSSKLLGHKTSERKYRFASYSDVHMDKASEDKPANAGGRIYYYDETHLRKAFDTAAARDVDFIVASGDYVNNNIDFPGISVKEWKSYQKVLSESDYCNPVYEAIGNHELWQDVSQGTTDFIKATGLEGNTSSSSAKPYFEKTLGGDHFIFMALEGGFYPNNTEEFTNAQLDWLDGLLKKYSGDGKNIYVIEHSHFYKYGSGDRVDDEPYYDIPLKDTQESTRRLKTILGTYKDAIFITGHTHIAFSDQFNYSDNNGTTAQMIHNSSVGGVRHVKSDGTLDRNYREDDTEGYIVDVFDDAIIFNGTALYYNMYDPNCCYIVKTSAQIKGGGTTPSTDPTSATQATTVASSTAIPTYNTTSYYLKGSFNSWGTSNPLYTTNVSGLYSTTLKLNAGTYTFKINTSSTWYGNGGTVEDTTKKTSNGGWIFDTSSGDCTLKATGGYYTFTFNTSDKKVNIYYYTSDPYATEPTQAPTTVAPTTAKPTTAPTTAAPTTVAPTTAKPTTAPATAAPTTVAPTTAKPTTVPTTTAPTTAAPTTAKPTTAPATAAPTTVAPTTTEQPTTESDEYTVGDVNGDNEVTVVDATLIQKNIAKLNTFTDKQQLAGDVSGDSKISIVDATLIQKYVAKYITSFPCEKKSKALTGATTLSSVKSNLSLYYRYSSYDAYQALKKEYRKASPNTSTLTTLENALLAIVDPSNVDGNDTITVYFENTNGWSQPYAYAWKGSTTNAAWHGEKMTYVGMNEYNHSIYKYTLNMNTYESIIFNDGGSNQTKDITLSADSIAYYLDGSSSPYAVKSYVFKSSYIK